MLLTLDPVVRRRETSTGTSIGAVADGLTRELAPWLQSGLPIPDQKAKLTRAGGRCPVHGIALEFNPAAPHAHRCARCDLTYSGDDHHRWWIMGAQLFTAERAVHAAALFLLRGDNAHQQLALTTLQQLAERYARWPNSDNVLGPTRPFFSTYLESIWLLNICHALSLLEMAGPCEVGELLRERILAPSSALIATYHEGRSNRQVWNEVAILSALTLLGEQRRAEQRLEGEHSLIDLMHTGLLDDGTWFEGENYHQFAHRGLWYGVQWLESIGRQLPQSVTARFREGFVTPFAALLPDDTLPSRRDSQYAVSVRQWRWAEWCELGYAQTSDQRLAAMLTRLYDGRAVPGPSNRMHSTADAERNMPAVALSRADCSWRALLMANAAPAPSATWQPQSMVQSRQGVALIRRETAAVYVALEGGVHGGGHGHPDRLSLTLQSEDARWLDDPGTGSYVERTLHWYRSTLAHHAPLVNGASQQLGATVLEAFEDRGGAGWVRKRAAELAPGVHATRSLIVCDGYLVDLLEWESDHDVTVTLPVAGTHTANVAQWRAIEPTGAGALEDGYDFLRQSEEAVDPPSMVCLELAPVGRRPQNATQMRTMRAWYSAGDCARWWRAIVPGAPGCDPESRLMAETSGVRGRFVGVWSWSVPGASDVAVTDVKLNATGSPVATVTTHDGTIASHEPAQHGWHIGLLARHSRSSIDLEGLVTDAPVPVPTERAIPPVSRVVQVPRCTSPGEVESQGLPCVLDADHYVPTEVPWGGENSPRATLTLGATESELILHVRVVSGHAAVVPTGGDAQQMPDNPLDNERADVNADGLQCYLSSGGDGPGQRRAAILAVPLPHGGARVTSLVAGGPTPELQSQLFDDGWSLTLRWARQSLPHMPLLLDLVVNERPPHRERRRGQLVLGGGAGFGYLRGDRHTSASVVEIHLP